MANRERLGILISGGGTTMQEIVRASQSGELPVDIAVVISSKEDAGGREKARSLGAPEVFVDRNRFVGDDKKIDQYGYGQELLRVLNDYGATMVSQNGWLPMTPDNVIEKYRSAIFNQHPGPVPEFGGKGMYGKRVHAAVLLFRRLTNGEMWTEVIGQRVSPSEYDGGVVLKSERIQIEKGDDVDDLQQRALPREHRVQIELLKDAAAGRLVKVRRETILQPGQEAILSQAKRMAQLLYPRG